MSNNNNHDIKNVPLLHLVISTGFGTGFVPIARKRIRDASIYTSKKYRSSFYS